MTRHIIFHRNQLLSLAKTLEEFEGILAVDFQYIEDTMEPVRIEYIWEDDEE